jgi:hypothetical protein
MDAPSTPKAEDNSGPTETKDEETKVEDEQPKVETPAPKEEASSDDSGSNDKAQAILDKIRNRPKA